VVEEAPWPQPAAEPVSRPLHILTLSAKSQRALQALAGRYERHILAHPHQTLADICFTANTGRAHFGFRSAIVVESADDACRKLANLAQRQDVVEIPGNRPTVGFVCAGQTSPDSDAGDELFRTEPTFRRAVEQCHAVLGFVPAPGSTAALFSLEFALSALWRSWGVEPRVLAGTGTGERVAACLSGNRSLENAIGACVGTVDVPATTRQGSPQGCDLFVEIGPDATVAGCLPSLRPGRGDWRQLLETLATLYRHGADVDWAAFDRNHARRKVALPTSLFQRQKYWITLGACRTEDQGNMHHPLLGRRLESPAMKDVVFESQLSRTDPAFLPDHKVYGTTIVAATTYFEMALAAAAEAWGPQAYALQDVAIREALVLDDDEPRRLQVVLRQGGENSFEIYSRNRDGQGEDEWTLHVAGKIAVSPAEAKPAQEPSLEQARTNCRSEISAENYYHILQEHGLEYGPAFRSIQRLWRGDGQSLGLVELPEPLRQEAGGYICHPAVLDACFQVMGAAGKQLFEPNGDACVTAGFDSLRYYSATEPRMWCHAHLSPSSAKGAFSGKLQLYGESGKRLAEISGIWGVSTEIFQKVRRQ
jgi:acyl transferase domain-containing protein